MVFITSIRVTGWIDGYKTALVSTPSPYLKFRYILRWRSTCDSVKSNVVLSIWRNICNSAKKQSMVGGEMPPGEPPWEKRRNPLWGRRPSWTLYPCKVRRDRRPRITSHRRLKVLRSRRLRRDWFQELWLHSISCVCGQLLRLELVLGLGSGLWLEL